MIYKPQLLFLAAALLFLPPSTVTAVRGTSVSDRESDCNSRCSVLEGEARYTCIRTCVSARKKNAPSGENQVKKKIRDCESACEQYKGIDNITCRRVCLDNKLYAAPQKKETVPHESPSPCETRCNVLTGPVRDNCIARCEKKSRFDGRGGHPVKNK
ncbi:MAG TPA: hypothetical protein PLM53_04350 [Spirochaetota bacterium]|nr:hypothetical protein [Spirochaetota bacterium]HPC41854.1 hypothetical protein [Spirochaetota bacterium]HPL19161.1 hypothetical protein [Spirochaetota bacterium]HQF07575.1 hypothetical protein [Spirochaetota bacterium]HQH96306.1 hypothetical protein [Spirochaetota bacterium]